MLQLFRSKQSNSFAVIKILLRCLNVKVSDRTITTTLENHPEHPSLLSLSESLGEWRVTNDAYQIEKDEYESQDLLYPFIAHLKPAGGSFIVVHKIEHGKVTYSNEQSVHKDMAEEDFLKKWSGAALYATAMPNCGEKDYRHNLLQDKFDAIKLPLLIVTTFAAIYFALDFGQMELGHALLLLVKLIGISVSALLLVHSIDANNPLVQNLCSLGKKNNCNAILKSDAAKLTAWLNWSEVGFFYFAGSFITLLLIPGAATLIALLNLLALPYTVYSLTYQYRQKNWCVLCCVVQFVLLSEFLVNLIAGASFNIGQVAAWPVPEISVCFLIPILTWAVLKPFFLEAALTRSLKNQLKKFKYNTELFNQILQKQPKYGVPNELMPIMLGNPEAETVITIVSNPFCEPCAKAHQLIDEWLSYRDDIQLKLIFSTADHDDDDKTKVSRHVNALSLLNDTKLVEKALNDWYGQGTKRYDTWAAKYPVSFNGEMNEVTQKQKAWCEMANISVTPTVLLNGYKLPEPYHLSDIKYLLS